MSLNLSARPFREERIFSDSSPIPARQRVLACGNHIRRVDSCTFQVFLRQMSDVTAVQVQRSGTSFVSSIDRRGSSGQCRGRRARFLIFCRSCRSTRVGFSWLISNDESWGSANDARPNDGGKSEHSSSARFRRLASVGPLRNSLTLCSFPVIVWATLILRLIHNGHQLHFACP